MPRLPSASRNSMRQQPQRGQRHAASGGGEPVQRGVALARIGRAGDQGDAAVQRPCGGEVAGIAIERRHPRDGGIGAAAELQRRCRGTAALLQFAGIGLPPGGDAGAEGGDLGGVEFPLLLPLAAGRDAPGDRDQAAADPFQHLLLGGAEQLGQRAEIDQAAFPVAQPLDFLAPLGAGGGLGRAQFAAAAGLDGADLIEEGQRRIARQPEGGGDLAGQRGMAIGGKARRSRLPGSRPRPPPAPPRVSGQGRAAGRRRRHPAPPAGWHPRVRARRSCRRRPPPRRGGPRRGRRGWRGRSAGQPSRGGAARSARPVPPRHRPACGVRPGGSGRASRAARPECRRRGSPPRPGKRWGGAADALRAPGSRPGRRRRCRIRSNRKLRARQPGRAKEQSRGSDLLAPF